MKNGDRGAVKVWQASTRQWQTVAAKDTCSPDISHPDLNWARSVVRKNKGERVTDDELDTVVWNGLMGCYMMEWRGMTLGIETDGHIHS